MEQNMEDKEANNPVPAFQNAATAMASPLYIGAHGGLWTVAFFDKLLATGATKVVAR
jgi:hypothetical protein